jgi:hypothetical protein
MSLVTASTEIIDAIISFFPFDDNGDLKMETLVSLARVHSSLLAPSQRHIFRKISLGTTFSALVKQGPEQKHRHSRQKFEKRLTALISSPHLIGYIRDLTLGPMILQEYSYIISDIYYGYHGEMKCDRQCYWPLEDDVKELINLFDKNRSQVTKLTLRGARPNPCYWRDVQEIAISWLREVLLPTTKEFKIVRLSGVDLGALFPSCIQLHSLVILGSACSRLSAKDVAALLEKAYDLMTKNESRHSLDSLWMKALEEFTKGDAV